MTLSNDKAINTYGIIANVGGTMGTATRPVVVGKAYVFNVDGYKVIKEVIAKESNYKITGKNITETFYTDVFHINKINSINSELRNNIVSKIMAADLTRVKNVMNTNKKGFLHFMNNLQDTKGLSKDLAFAEVVKDFYSDEFNHPYDTNAIIKVMIKYGYKFNNMAEANKLIR